MYYQIVNNYFFTIASLFCERCEHDDRLDFVFENHLKKVRTRVGHRTLGRDEGRNLFEGILFSDPTGVDVVASHDRFWQNNSVSIVGNNVAVPQGEMF